MRQITVKAPRGRGDEVAARASDLGALSIRRSTALGEESPVDMVSFTAPNDELETIIEDVQSRMDAEISVASGAQFSLRPPEGEIPGEVADISFLSPIEIFIKGLQSVGSWRGFLGYASLGGVVAWCGMVTGQSFLLVAAMLIAPFAGPAMNAAIATARGDGELLMRSVGRYFAALLVSIAVSGGLSFLLAPPSATGLMVETSLVSRVAVLLPLAAGAAGALNLCQAERSSLVSGAATGVLIAASLAPQSALVGLALPLGDWSMVRSAMLVLLLQLTGINASGALVFRLCGLTPQGVRYTRGRGWKALATGAVTLAALGALLAWQFADHAQFERLSIEQRASASAEAAAASIQGARPVSVHADFTQRSRRGQDTLLAVLHVQRAKRAAASSEAMECEIIEAVSQKLRAEFQVIPLVAVHFVSTH